MTGNRTKKRRLFWAVMAIGVMILQGCGQKEQPDTIRWINAASAIMTQINGWDYNIYAGLKPSAASRRMEREFLEQWWNVTNRETAEETLRWVLEEGHRASFIEDVLYLDEVGLGDIDEQVRAAYILQNFDMTKEDAEFYANIYGMYEMYGEGAMDAWDYCHALNLLSFYYLADYYTQEEALDYSLEIALRLQPLYDSWDDMIEGYLRGYEYWSAQDSQERREIYESLLEEEDNPYAVNYHAVLEKSW